MEPERNTRNLRDPTMPPAARSATRQPNPLCQRVPRRNRYLLRSLRRLSTPSVENLPQVAILHGRVLSPRGSVQPRARTSPLQESRVGPRDVAGETKRNQPLHLKLAQPASGV